MTPFETAIQQAKAGELKDQDEVNDKLTKTTINSTSKMEDQDEK